MPWTQEQKQYLTEFYQGITDPETRFQMLVNRNMKDEGTEFSHYRSRTIGPKGEVAVLQDSNVPLAQKIAIEEFQILKHNGLLIPDYS
jgi:hypothetical protein